MKLSSDTINLLKNFADINPNILVKEGSSELLISAINMSFSSKYFLTPNE